MSERWKPGIGELYWLVAFNEAVSSEWRDDNADFSRWRMGNCFKTKEEADTALEKFTALLLSLHDEPVTNCNQLPKLTAEVFNRPDCPEWAKYAAVDKDGRACYYESKPPCSTDQFFEFKERSTILHGFFDSDNWQNSLIERPAQLPGWCKVGEWIYTSSEEYLRVESIDHSKIKLSNGATWSEQDIIDEAISARLRPYNADEMRSLVGKVVTTSSGRHCTLVTACRQEYSVIEPQVMLNKWLYATDLLNGGNTIDGKPCGKLEHFENGEWVE